MITSFSHNVIYHSNAIFSSVPYPLLFYENVSVVYFPLDMYSKLCALNNNQVHETESDPLGYC